MCAICYCMEERWRSASGVGARECVRCAGERGSEAQLRIAHSSHAHALIHTLCIPTDKLTCTYLHNYDSISHVTPINLYKHNGYTEHPAQTGPPRTFKVQHLQRGVPLETLRQDRGSDRANTPVCKQRYGKFRCEGAWVCGCRHVWICCII